MALKIKQITDNIWDLLKSIPDPEIPVINIVELGDIYLLFPAKYINVAALAILPFTNVYIGTLLSNHFRDIEEVLYNRLPIVFAKLLFTNSVKDLL